MTPGERARAEEVFARWREREAAGEAVDPEAVIAEHPEIATPLRDLFAVLPLLDRVAADAWAAPSSGPATESASTTACDGQGDATTPSAGPADGRRLGDFVLRREIGRGGMGVVYEADQVSMRRVVALKVLYPSVTLHPKAVARFRREAQAAGRLHHTNIVSVYGMGEESGTWFYAMERIQGRTLADVIADLARLTGRHPPAEGDSTTPFTSGRTGRSYYERVANAFADLAGALEHAHAAGVLHRDVKPSNLLLDQDGTIKLTDFGLARLDEADAAALTFTGDRIGTPDYMSPEQVRSDGAVDARTDVYSLGATLYELLTLRPPFEGAKHEQVFAAILSREPIAPRRHVPRVPRDLETIVLKALEKDPARRYLSAGDFERDLRLFGEGAAIRARRANVFERTWRHARRRKRAIATFAGIGLAGTVAAWALVRGGRERELRADLEYESAIRSVVTTMLEKGRFGEGRLLQLADRPTREIRERLVHAAAVCPRRPEARLLPVLLAQTPLEARLSDLDASRRDGLDERAWQWGKAYVRLSDSASERGAQEGPDSSSRLGDEDRITVLLECYVLSSCGRRRAALDDLDRLLNGPFDAIDRPLALMARAFAREQEGDASGALEDYAALETQLGLSWPLVRVRMAALWRGLGREDRARPWFDETLAAVRRTEREDAVAYVAMFDGCRRGGVPAEWWDRVTAAALEDRPGYAEVIEERARCLRGRPSPDLEEVAALEERAFRAAKSDSMRLDCLIDLGELRFQQSRPEEALKAAERGLELDGRSGPASAMKAWALSALGHKDEGRALADAASRRDPSHRTLHLSGIALDVGGDAEGALAMFRRASLLDPSCRSCCHAIAEIESRAKRWAETERACREALARFPDAVEFLYILVDALDAQHRFDDVVDVERRLTQLEPNDAIDWANYADSLNNVRQFEKGLEAVRHARDLGLDNVEVHQIAAASLAGLDRIDAAVAEFEQVVAAGQDDVSVWEESSRIQQDAGRLEPALKTIERGILRFPQNASLELNRGVVLDRLHRLAPSLEAFRRSLALDPGSGRAWANAALAEERLGNVEKAIDTANEGLRRTGAPRVRWTLGCILKRRRTQVEARDVCAPLFLETPKDDDACQLGGLALGLFGTLSEATSFLDRVRAGLGTAAAAVQADRVAGDWRRAGRAADATALAKVAVAWPDLEGERAARLLIVAGRTSEGASLLPGLATPTGAPAAYSRASLCALLARREDAIHWLDRALLEGFHDDVTKDPDFAAFAGDPAVTSRLERISRRP